MTNMRDTISIKGLEIHANHGVFPEEKKLGQKFVLNIDLITSIREAALNDDLGKTIHYGEVCHEVTRYFTENRFDLIETCVEKLAEHILLYYPPAWEITLEVRKPWAPIGLPLEYASVCITRKRHRAYIALGSNVGDREGNISQAISAIEKDGRNRVLKSSSLIETEPVGYLDQEKFLNGALLLETLLTPDELLDQLQAIEHELKRVRTIRNGPRTIDLDILLYDDLVTSGEHLVIPHPRMEERLFVLQPLCEIAPYIVHPLQKVRMETLKERLTDL